MTDPVAPQAAPSAGLWEDFIDIFHSPSQVFDRRRDGKFGLALLLLVVIFAVLYIALNNGLAPITEAEVAKQAAAMAEKNPAMTAEQISGARGAMEKFAMFGAIIFIAGNQPMETEITALLTFIRLEEYNYEGAVALAFVLLLAAFATLMLTNALQAWQNRYVLRSR